MMSEMKRVRKCIKANLVRSENQVCVWGTGGGGGPKIKSSSGLPETYFSFEIFKVRGNFENWTFFCNCRHMNNTP